MLRNIHEARKNEEGFTLIELLVVVIIIGILAAIAIPVFLNQREKAWDTAAQSTLRNAAVAMESYFTENGVYTSTISGELDEYGWPDTTGSDIALNIDSTGTAGESFCVDAKHNSSQQWFKVSDGGAQPATGEC